MCIRDRVRRMLWFFVETSLNLLKMQLLLLWPIWKGGQPLLSLSFLVVTSDPPQQAQVSQPIKNHNLATVLWNKCDSWALVEWIDVDVLCTFWIRKSLLNGCMFSSTDIWLMFVCVCVTGACGWMIQFSDASVVTQPNYWSLLNLKITCFHALASTCQREKCKSV